MSDPSKGPSAGLVRPSIASQIAEPVSPTPFIARDHSGGRTELQSSVAASLLPEDLETATSLPVDSEAGVFVTPIQGSDLAAMSSEHPAMGALSVNANSEQPSQPALEKIVPLATSMLQALNSGQSPAQIALSLAAPVLSAASPKLGKMASMAAPAMQAMNFTGSKLDASPSPSPVMTRPIVADDNPMTGRSINDFASQPSAFTPPPADDMQAMSFSSVAGALAQLNETTRLLRFYGPLSGDKQLFIQSIVGSAALSEVGAYTLQLVALNANIDLKDVLSKNVTTTIKLATGEEAPINGYVNRFRFSHADGGLAYYEATVVPWMWYLEKRVNSRIFQQMSVLDVLDQLFQEYGGLADYAVRVAKRPEPVDYIVQYDESDLHFVSRLMEQLGLFYFFIHRSDGHQMVISDDSTDKAHCPPQEHHAVIRFNAGDRMDLQDGLTQLSAEREIQPAMVALNTYDYKQPGGSLYVEQPSLTDQGEVPKLQVFSGNPAFAYPSTTDGNLEAQRRMEVFEWQAKVFHATSECRGIQAGHTFELLDHPWFAAGDTENATFIVVGAELEAHNNHLSQIHGDGDVYSNRLLLIRRKIPYRPVRRHTKPVMRGPQMATVVGPKGQEIYTDAHGRIKVQFPWDRYGRNDESSSCWIRVSQPWAGRGWGTVAIPRINQEVIIDFFEGDPDRPVCIGRLFNTDQTPPYALPDGAHMMGFHSNSTPGGGGHCEMVIHDKKGEELINFHSQKDMSTTVQNNQVSLVNGPHQTNTVSTGLQTNTVKKSITTHAQTEHIETKAHTYMHLCAETDYILANAKTALALVAETDAVGVQAKTYVSVEAQTEHVLIKGKTSVKLEAGESSLELREDGTILINGKVVQVTGTSSIDLNP